MTTSGPGSGVTPGSAGRTKTVAPCEGSVSGIRAATPIHVAPERAGCVELLAIEHPAVVVPARHRRQSLRHWCGYPVRRWRCRCCAPASTSRVDPRGRVGALQTLDAALSTKCDSSSWPTAESAWDRMRSTSTAVDCGRSGPPWPAGTMIAEQPRLPRPAAVPAPADIPVSCTRRRHLAAMVAATERRSCNSLVGRTENRGCALGLVVMVETVGRPCGWGNPSQATLKGRAGTL